jgi:hypothetical protein
MPGLFVYVCLYVFNLIICYNFILGSLRETPINSVFFQGWGHGLSGRELA